MTPVSCAWHATQPVVMCTAHGTLTGAACRALREQCLALLAEGPPAVVRVLDLSGLVAFPDAGAAPDETLLTHPQVVGTVVVLEAGLYHRLARAMGWSGPLKVFFCPDLDAALALAGDRLGPDAVSR